jgi:hypothetical protein
MIPDAADALLLKTVMIGMKYRSAKTFDDHDMVGQSVDIAMLGTPFVAAFTVPGRLITPIISAELTS